MVTRLLRLRVEMTLARGYGNWFARRTMHEVTLFAPTNRAVCFTYFISIERFSTIW